MSPPNALTSPTIHDVQYIDITTPEDKPVHPSTDSLTHVPVTKTLYSSVALVLLLVLQFGWSVSQLNLSTFNDKDACNARPVAEGTCLMFPGHSSGQWSIAVNGWIVGGAIGALGSARVSDLLGRKKSLMLNAIVVIIGSTIQASAQTVFMLAVGRFISGIGSGTSTSIPNSFINEVAPPYLRNPLGVLYQCSVGVGIILVGISFFFANTSSGWRYIAGFPIVLAVLFLLLAPALMVESPPWLLTKGRQEDAEREIARLYGHDNVKRALAWMTVQDVEQGPARPSASLNGTEETASQADEENPFKVLISKRYRMQTLLAVMLSLGQQLAGINAVFFYSSSIFRNAGLHDDRIGSVIVDVFNLFPTFFAGALGTRFGNRGMMLFGHVAMLISAVGMTISLVATISWLSIVFTALYVGTFAVSLGPLPFVIATSLFPNQLRATGTSICLFANWVGTLVVGIGYPHVADALDDWGFAPFVVLLALFGAFMTKYLPETAGKSFEEIDAIFIARQQQATKEIS